MSIIHTMEMVAKENSESPAPFVYSSILWIITLSIV